MSAPGNWWHAMGSGSTRAHPKPIPPQIRNVTVLLGVCLAEPVEQLCRHRDGGAAAFVAETRHGGCALLGLWGGDSEILEHAYPVKVYVERGWLRSGAGSTAQRSASVRTEIQPQRDCTARLVI